MRACRLHYEVRGERDGPALLFLHGFMGSLHDWTDTVDGLPRFRCILPDLPGHGGTERCESSDYYSMAGASAALIRVLDDLGVDTFTPIGYSMGGRLALYLAVEYPARCQRIVMESASPGIATDLERQQRRRWDEGKAAELETWEFSSFLAMWYRQPLFESLVRNHDRFEAILKRREQNDPFELARCMRGMGTGVQPSLWPAVEKLDFPMLAIAGALDAKYRKAMRDMVRLSKSGRCRVVPGAGHNVHCEAPEAYAGVLKEFLTDQH